jgi:hypothetical protein
MHYWTFVNKHKVVLEVVVNKELKIALEDKVYLETYYHHRPCHVYETLTKLKV